ncbi:hypothetical protein NEPAR04_1684 [Nematocida parisii]|nr:hypothetical protein NEPAR04_1684 [Nematocida parisii]
MVILNSLKILSSGTRQSLTVQYKPSEEIRKSFILPPLLYVYVEIFPISEINVFSRAEPLYFIDGYLGAQNGKPYITACTSDKFISSQYQSYTTVDQDLQPEHITQCINNKIDLLIHSAIRKSEASRFNVKDAICLRLVVFLIKINRLKEAQRCIKENMPSSYSLFKVIPYIIYEMLLFALLNSEDPAVIDDIAYISTALRKMENSNEEDRVINSILVGLSLSAAKRTPSILNMYSRVQVSPHKSSIFFYMLSLYIGPGYNTKYTLMGLAMDKIGCNMCLPSKIDSSRKTIQSIISLESDLVTDRTPYDLVLDEYIHAKGSIPDPEIWISSGIGEYMTQNKETLSCTKTRSVYSIDQILKDREIEAADDENSFPITAIYTEGDVLIEVNNPHVQVTGLLLNRLPSNTTVISCNSTQVKQKEKQIILPICACNGVYRFFVSASCEIAEVHLKYKGSAYSKALNLSIEVLEVPIDKKIVAHRLCVVPGHARKESQEKKEIEAYLHKFIKAPFTVMSFNPLKIRLPFAYNEKMLYTETALDWEYVEIIKIKEEEDTLKIESLQKDITIRYNNIDTSINAFNTKTIQKKGDNKISWSFNDNSKSGEFFL